MFIIYPGVFFTNPTLRTTWLKSSRTAKVQKPDLSWTIWLNSSRYEYIILSFFFFKKPVCLKRPYDCWVGGVEWRCVRAQCVWVCQCVCVWVWLCVSLCHQSVSEGFGKPEDRLWLIAWLNWITYYPVPMLKKIGSEKPPLLWKSHTGNGWKSGVKNHQGNQENHYTAASNVGLESWKSKSVEQHGVAKLIAGG